MPHIYKQLSETWKKYHPGWKYEFWNGDRMKDFVNNNYPHLAEMYFDLKYNIQRWDVIRYLILHKIGGMYIDFDYECLECFEPYLTKEKCYFAIEPEEHRHLLKNNICITNALMITPPSHPFFESVIVHLQKTPVIYTNDKFDDVLNSTGPRMLSNLYEKFENKNKIHLFSPDLVMPWSLKDVRNYLNGIADEEMLEKKLEKAIAIHYFYGYWLKNDK